MTRKSVFIIGADRKIGFNLVKAFIAESWEVTGTVHPQTRAHNTPIVAELEKTGTKILELDYLDEGTIEKAAVAYGDRPLDMLVNLGTFPSKVIHWDEQTVDMMVEEFRVIAVGPLMAAKHFLPKLERASKGKIVNVSSAWGSVSASEFGLYLAYRAANAALTQGVVTMAREWESEGRKATTVCVEPDLVSIYRTDQGGELCMGACIARLMEIFKQITPEDNGMCLLWDGSRIQR